MWVCEMLFAQDLSGVEGSAGEGAGSCSARSDGKSESFSLQVFSCRVPGLCTHPPLSRHMAFYFSESSCQMQASPFNAEQGERRVQQPCALCTVFQS